jgi:hypothetical protein
MTEAVAETIASTDLYIKLVAEAASTSTAEVCLTGVPPLKVFGTVTRNYTRSVCARLLQERCQDGRVMHHLACESQSLNNLFIPLPLCSSAK